MRAPAPLAALPDDVAQDRGRGGWGGGGYRGGWGGGGGWRGHHHEDIDGGDILAGLLILGGIAVIASAASEGSKKNERAPYSYPDQAGSGQSEPRDWGRSRAIDDAVDGCVSEVERSSARVDTVDAVNREGEGWRVSGRATSGAPFDCQIDGSGRIRSVTLDGHAR